MTKKKGDQRHLTLSDRITIEKGLNNRCSFAEIGRQINKDPTTVSKEVRKHAKVKEFNGYGTIPCQANNDIHARCVLKHICDIFRIRRCPKASWGRFSKYVLAFSRRFGYGKGRKAVIRRQIGFDKNDSAGYRSDSKFRERSGPRWRRRR